MNYSNLVINYGITDPAPVIAKYKKADTRAQSTFTRVLSELRAKITKDRQRTQADEFLAKHPKGRHD